jgi:prepilin-type N-terminal cleavage/methylation domain-containing protein
MSHRSGFTLIELLVVIAIIAVLSVVVILTLQPTELLRQSRDSNRFSDFSTLTTALGTYLAQGGSSLGSASTTYISIPDPAATTTAGDHCEGLGLPAAPSGFSYRCAASSTYNRVDGTGWIPVNFMSLNGTPVISSLPVDPINQTSSNLYYTYMTDGTRYEFTAVLESQKYSIGGSNDAESKDGGQYSNLYEKGTNLSLLPRDPVGALQQVVQYASNECTGGTCSVAFSSNVTAGDLLVVTVSSFGINTPTDASGDTFTNANSIGNGVNQGLYYTCSAAGGATTISMAGGGRSVHIHALEITGNLTSGCLDVNNTNGGGGVSVTSLSASVTPNQAHEIIVGSFDSNFSSCTTVTAGSESTQLLATLSTGTPSGNWPMITSVYNSDVGLSGLQTQTANCNATSNYWNATIAGFKLH